MVVYDSWTLPERNCNISKTFREKCMALIHSSPKGLKIRIHKTIIKSMVVHGFWTLTERKYHTLKT